MSSAPPPPSYEELAALVVELKLLVSARAATIAGHFPQGPGEVFGDETVTPSFIAELQADVFPRPTAH